MPTRTARGRQLAAAPPEPAEGAGSVRAMWARDWFDAPKSLFRPDLPIGPHERLTYLYLMRWDANEDRAFPGYTRMAQETGLSRRTIIRSIAALEAAGLLTKSQPVPGGSNHYRLYHPDDPDNAVRAAQHHPSTPAPAASAPPPASHGPRVVTCPPTAGSVGGTPPSRGSAPKTPVTEGHEGRCLPGTGGVPHRHSIHTEDPDGSIHTPAPARCVTESTSAALASDAALVARLCTEGLSVSVATALVTRHRASTIRHLAVLAAWPEGVPRPVRSPGGLRKAIEEDWVWDPPAVAPARPPAPRYVLWCAACRHLQDRVFLAPPADPATAAWPCDRCGRMLAWVEAAWTEADWEAWQHGQTTPRASASTGVPAEVAAWLRAWRERSPGSGGRTNAATVLAGS